jgi:hypothetical protein
MFGKTGVESLGHKKQKAPVKWGFCEDFSGEYAGVS